MPNYQPINRDRHSGLRWRRDFTFAFAAGESVVPLVAAELPRAIMSLPVAFMEQSGGFVPVAVLGLQPGSNLLVSADGRWNAAYVPAKFRAYPFFLAKMAEDQRMLCFDEDSGLLTTNSSGSAFFAEDGKPVPAVADALNLLTQIERSQVMTKTACAVLQKHQLFYSWPITVKTSSGEQQVGGLFSIDEAVLNRLTGEALAEVFQSGALAMAQCQLLSKQHLPILGQALEARNRAAQALASETLAPNGELNLEFFNNNGTISFAGLL